MKWPRDAPTSGAVATSSKRGDMADGTCVECGEPTDNPKFCSLTCHGNSIRDHVTCTVDGCERPHQAKGYCSPHYQERRRSGKLDTPECSVDGCHRPHDAHGRCRTHYRAERPPPRYERQCEACGNAYSTPRHDGRVCSLNCWWFVNPRTHKASEVPWYQCRTCEAWFVQRGTGSPVYCSDACRDTPVDYGTGECVECGSTFPHSPTQHGQQIYCGHACARRSSKRRRRARKRGVEFEEVWRSRVFQRDGYRCGICHRKCKPNVAVPHPLAPTLDHIIPLAEGGSHTYRNIQTACFRCNCLKSHTGPGQLRLIG